MISYLHASILLAFMGISSLRAGDLDNALPYSSFHDDLSVLSYFKNKNPSIMFEYCFSSKKEGLSFYVLSDGPGQIIFICREREIKIEAKIDGLKIDNSKLFNPVRIKVSGQVSMVDGGVKDTESGSMMHTIGHRIRRPNKGNLVIKFTYPKSSRNGFEVIWGDNIEFAVKELRDKG